MHCQRCSDEDSPSGLQLGLISFIIQELVGACAGTVYNVVDDDPASRDEVMAFACELLGIKSAAEPADATREAGMPVKGRWEGLIALMHADMACMHDLMQLCRTMCIHAADASVSCIVVAYAAHRWRRSGFATT